MDDEDKMLDLEAQVHALTIAFDAADEVIMRARRLIEEITSRHEIHYDTLHNFLDETVEWIRNKEQQS